VVYESSASENVVGHVVGSAPPSGKVPPSNVPPEELLLAPPLEEAPLLDAPPEEPDELLPELTEPDELLAPPSGTVIGGGVYGDDPLDPHASGASGAPRTSSTATKRRAPRARDVVITTSGAGADSERAPQRWS
jgi:hypothetical protein